MSDQKALLPLPISYHVGEIFAKPPPQFLSTTAHKQKALGQLLASDCCSTKLVELSDSLDSSEEKPVVLRLLFVELPLGTFVALLTQVMRRWLTFPSLSQLCACFAAPDPMENAT